VPCKKFGPDFDSVASTYRAQADFEKLNGEEPANESLREKYGVKSYPRFIFTDSTGARLDEIQGAPTRQQFESRVRRLLGKS
jgi:thioredoxin-related protein